MDLTTYIIESTIFLGCSYGLYHLFLKRGRSFIYVRFYLLLALLLSLFIPFLKIEVHSTIPIAAGISDGEFYTLLALSGEESLGSSGHTGSPVSVFMLIYLTGMVLMFLRYLINLSKLIRKTKQGITLQGPQGSVILSDNEGMPYSFFRYTFMNRGLYERGTHLENLLLHENVHCRQFHSADILFAELLKVVQWYNPFAWLMVKSIRLNHEFIADEKVLESQNKDSYQLLLVDMELANQSNCMASEFNNSLTKKRLAMMNKKNFGKSAVIGKLASVPLFLFLVMVLSFCEAEQESNVDPSTSSEFYANDWWKPILEKHGIIPGAYNNFEYIFEMGSANSIDENNVVTLKDAFILLRTDGNSYTILRSPLATHNLETNMISCVEGSLDTYDLHQAEPEPVDHFEGKNIRFRLVKNGLNLTADYLEWGPAEDKTILKGNVIFEARDSLVINTERKRSEE